MHVMWEKYFFQSIFLRIHNSTLPSQSQSKPKKVTQVFYFYSVVTCLSPHYAQQ